VPGRKDTVFRLRRFNGRAITVVRVFVGRRLVMTRRDRSLRTVSLAGLPRTGIHTVRAYEYTRKGFARRGTRTVLGCAG
jgi:hypothetical protein